MFARLQLRLEKLQKEILVVEGKFIYNTKHWETVFLQGFPHCEAMHSQASSLLVIVSLL